MTVAVSEECRIEQFKFSLEQLLLKYLGTISCNEINEAYTIVVTKLQNDLKLNKTKSAALSTIDAQSFKELSISDESSERTQDFKESTRSSRDAEEPSKVLKVQDPILATVKSQSQGMLAEQLTPLIAPPSADKSPAVAPAAPAADAPPPRLSSYTSLSSAMSLSAVVLPALNVKASGAVATAGLAPEAKRRYYAALWRRAVFLSTRAADPWTSRNLHLLPMERAERLRFNLSTREWVRDDVLVRMESRPFAAGAMRECLALKKMSTFTHSIDWRRAQNCVAKRYKCETAPLAWFFNDLLVQSDAKLFGEMYNQTNPPKPVDVIQCALLRLPGRRGEPVFSVEQLIEGDYVKYNSNSGFVSGETSDVVRNTPQAFSHYSWVLTKGQKICVDIQGVGDLYTDPQVHTLDGHGYGEGNLGLRGMALFFRTHVCNDLCRRLKLKPFARCDADIRLQAHSSGSNSPRELPGVPASGKSAVKSNKYVVVPRVGLPAASPRLPAAKGMPPKVKMPSVVAVAPPAHRKLARTVWRTHPGAGAKVDIPRSGSGLGVMTEQYFNDGAVDAVVDNTTPPKAVASTTTAAAASVNSWRTIPKNIDDLIAMLSHVPKTEGPAALIHLEVAKLYAEVVMVPELRPEEDPAACKEGGLFHLQRAAAEGCVQALCAFARVHAGQEPEQAKLAHLIKVGRQAGLVTSHPAVALLLTQMAADRGVRRAMLALAHAHTGGWSNLPDEALPADAERRRIAVQYYELALKTRDVLEEKEAEKQEAADHLDNDESDDDEINHNIPSHSCSMRHGGEYEPSSSSAAKRNSVAVLSSTECFNGDLRQLPKLYTRRSTCRNFRGATQRAAEEEAAGLPGASMHRYEVLAALGEILMEDPDEEEAGEWYEPVSEEDEGALDREEEDEEKEADSGEETKETRDRRRRAQRLARASEVLYEAAEEATTCMKGKLASKYFELAANADGMMEEEEEV